MYSQTLFTSHSRLPWVVALAIVVLFMGFFPQQAAADYRYPRGIFISEETPPDACPLGDPVVTLTCDGSYCDRFSLSCASKHFDVIDRSWEPFISDEGTNWNYCDYDGFITGLACKGRYCDSIAIECSSFTHYKRGACQWFGWGSEENRYVSVPDGYYAAGVQCRGSYCDEKRFYGCQVVPR
jgi:hypothetical protein